MSRSHKKNYYYTDGSPKTTKRFKRFAQKVVRNAENIPMKGSSYKKLFESYNIHDYKSYSSWEDFKKLHEEGYIMASSDKDLYRWWLKCYYTK